MTTTAVMNGQDITITSSQLSSPYTIKSVEADPLTGEYNRINGLMSKHLQLALAAGDNLNVAMDEVQRSAEKLVRLKELYDLQSTSYWSQSPGFEVKQEMIRAGVAFPLQRTPIHPDGQLYVEFKNPEMNVNSGLEGHVFKGSGSVITIGVQLTLAQIQADPSQVAMSTAYRSADGILFAKEYNRVTGQIEISEIALIGRYPPSDSVMTPADIESIKDELSTAANKATLVSLDLQNTVQKLVATKSTHELAITALIKRQEEDHKGVARNI